MDNTGKMALQERAEMDRRHKPTFQRAIRGKLGGVRGDGDACGKFEVNPLSLKPSIYDASCLAKTVISGFLKILKMRQN